MLKAVIHKQDLDAGELFFHQFGTFCPFGIDNNGAHGIFLQKHAGFVRQSHIL